MSEKSLPDKKLKQYEVILETEKEATLSLIRAIDETQRKSNSSGSGDVSQYSLHQADQGTDTDSREREVYMLEEEQKKLKKLNLALRRIYEKTYGICEICGGYIPEFRLKIIPYARYCIECKSAEEQRKKRR
ncbi:MAG: TraR/DksA C4-type zinc finger protein [Candidatus Cloacimonetes bacterium]|nr:TraR/DksA C4-type zinc finger protein [Candidatus Cloacimonadota bacterium]